MEEKISEVPYIEREIGKHNYRAYQLQLGKWADLTEHLAGMLGKPFAAALRGGSLDVDAMLGQDTVLVVLALVMERLTARNLLALVEKAKPSLQFESATGGWNVKKVDQHHVHWQHNMTEMGPAMALFLEAQYRDFFGGLKGLMPDLQSDPNGPAESTGQSSTPSQST